jgi:hypothetical protein
VKKLVLALALLPLGLMAQETTPAAPSHEIGINLFSATDYLQPEFQLHPMGGFFYNYHFGQNALRASFDYRQQVSFIHNGGYDELFLEDKASITRNYEMKIGYEREFGKGLLKAYVYDEIIALVSQEKGVHTWYGCFGGGVNEPINTVEYGGGLTMGGGLRADLYPHLSLSLELGLVGYYAFHQDLLHPSYLVYGDFNYRLDPLNRLGLSWRF